MRRPHRLALWAALPALAVPLTLTPPALAHQPEREGPGGSYVETVLVRDTGPAPVVDGDLVNPWGIAFGPATPLWTADEATSKSTLYRGTSTGNATKVPLTVSVPGRPTGIVFNSTTAFALPDGRPGRFLFDTLSGQLAAWTPGTTSTVTTASPMGAHFTGLALDTTNPVGPRLFAADPGTRQVRVFDGAWHQVGVLTARHLPAGLVPYGVAVLDGDVYVTYEPPPGGTAEVDGAVQVFRATDDGEEDRGDGADDANATGVQLRGHPLVTGGPLSHPWGLALAPEGWGRFGGDLLVGNVESGQIDAFSRHSGRFDGVVADASGAPLVNGGLWGMQFGNGVIGTPQDLVVAAGPGEYHHGLVALVRPAG